MVQILLSAVVLLIGQSEVRGFSKPSEAFANANAPLTEWESAVKAGRQPKTHIAPTKEVRLRANALCRLFTIDEVSGEELYWLAKLCENQPAIGKPVVQRYLAQASVGHRPEAHLLLSVFEMSANRSWVAAWETLRRILQEDPFGPDQEVRLRGAIEEEADEDEETALKWAEERYSLLRGRLKPSNDKIPPVAADWVILAGTDLVHRYHLAGQADHATAVLAEINELKKAGGNTIGPWASDDLNWANMEMQPAPAVPVLKALGGGPGSGIVQPGRVEVISFFFLRCSPCITELPGLNELQDRYPKDKVLIVDVTTYRVALQPDTLPHNQIESAIEKTRRQKSPHLIMALTSEETLNKYGVNSFPVTAVIDKAGRLRYVGVPNGFDPGEEIDRLVRRLTQERAQ